MNIHGRVHNGVVVLEGGASLPEGMAVTVSCEAARRPKAARKKRPVALPLVKSNRPGSLHLTNERIAEILEEEDLAEHSQFFRRGKS
jgi:hypothetical protein